MKNVCLVIGAGAGIGGTTAKIFAENKYHVHLLRRTDEHGLKIQREAEKNKKKPKIFCDDLSKNFRDLTKILNLSNLSCSLELLSF